MAFYQRFSFEPTCKTNGRPSSWIGNGSWVVDHFSAAGAKKATGFWDQNIFNDGEIDCLTREVGMYSWEDIMEMMSPLWWTPDFLSRFKLLGDTAPPNTCPFSSKLATYGMNMASHMTLRTCLMGNRLTVGNIQKTTVSPSTRATRTSSGVTKVGDLSRYGSLCSACIQYAA